MATNHPLHRLARRCALFALTVAGLISAPAVMASSNIWLTNADIGLLRSQPARTAALMQRCDKEIDTQAAPVAVFAPPAHYSKTGVVENAMGKRFASDGELAYRAALCYAVSQDLRYAQHAQAIISAWADTLQYVPSEQGASDLNFDLPAYVIAASMVRNANRWNDASFRHLITRIALPLSHSDRKNNHANWGVLLNASIAAYTGDAALLASSRTRWLELMDSEVAADGSLPLEICRSDSTAYCSGARKGINGLSYTHYTLLPTIAAARIFDLQGQAVWHSPQGNKLSAAYRKAAAWTLHPETFPYYQSNGGRLNGVNNAAYFTLLQRQFPNADGGQVIANGKLWMNGLEWVVLFP
ncbi:alginate lyase family protein [Janthinobacterium sp.]|uniref:alginate lyase family protein n=1 Tax=Janthinobacterium sp. TaxID=1871054 RepID=UPI00262F18FA|nr:alginate lyase family protein [Janthinobacterium sp.]